MTRGLVIGLGSSTQGDDAVGLLVARRLRDLTPPDTEIREHEGDLTALLALWEGYAPVVVIDAMRSGAPPGTVRRFEAHSTPLPATLEWGLSTHGIGLAETIELARALGKLPPRLLVYGIEGRCFAPGADPTPEVAQAIPRAVESIRRDLRA